MNKNDEQMNLFEIERSNVLVSDIVHNFGYILIQTSNLKIAKNFSFFLSSENDQIYNSSVSYTLMELNNEKLYLTVCAFVREILDDKQIEILSNNGILKLEGGSMREQVRFYTDHHNNIKKGDDLGLEYFELEPQYIIHNNMDFEFSNLMTTIEFFFILKIQVK